VFHRLFKHKNTPICVAFSTLFSVFGYPDETLSLVQCLIYYLKYDMQPKEIMLSSNVRCFQKNVQSKFRRRIAVALKRDLEKIAFINQWNYTATNCRLLFSTTLNDVRSFQLFWYFSLYPSLILSSSFSHEFFKIRQRGDKPTTAIYRAGQILFVIQDQNHSRRWLGMDDLWRCIRCSVDCYGDP